MKDTPEDVILDLTPKDRILTDLITLTIILAIIGIVCIFVIPILPEFTKNSDNTVMDTSVIQEPVIVEFTPVREPTEIESLINDIMLYSPAGKTRYAHNPDSVKDVHISINKAIDQAEWIIGNYNYETGIVMMWNKYIGDDHAQTWVDVNGTRYVIDSTSNYYWTVEKHADHWSSKYKIQYTTVQKGLQFEKESNENLNNKDV